MQKDIFDESVDSVANKIIVYLYECQFIEGVLREILGLISLIMLLALGKFHEEIKTISSDRVDIELDTFQKIIHSNSFGKNLELFLLFTKNRELYNKLKRHNDRRSKYIHHFFEMANKYEFFSGKNEKKFALFKLDLDKSEILARECADEIVKLRDELIKKYDIPDNLVLAKHKGWKDINGKQILFQD